MNRTIAYLIPVLLSNSIYSNESLDLTLVYHDNDADNHQLLEPGCVTDLLHQYNY